MHDKQLDALTRRIVRIASSADLGPPTPTRRERNLSHQGVAFSLGAGVSEEYDDLVRKCLNHADWGEKFSENYVEQSLRAIVAEALVNRESSAEARKKASKGLTSLVARLDEYAVEHTCYVPLAGLRLSSGDVELGQVVLEELTEERVNQLVGTVTTILNASKHTAPFHTVDGQRYFKRILGSSSTSPTCSSGSSSSAGASSQTARGWRVGSRTRGWRKTQPALTSSEDSMPTTTASSARTTPMTVAAVRTTGGTLSLRHRSYQHHLQDAQHGRPSLPRRGRHVALSCGRGGGARRLEAAAQEASEMAGEAPDRGRRPATGGDHKERSQRPQPLVAQNDRRVSCYRHTFCESRQRIHRRFIVLGFNTYSSCRPGRRSP